MHARSILRRIAGCTLILASALAGAANADDVAGPKARVSVQISGNSRDGRPGVVKGAGAALLEVGQTAVIGVYGDVEGSGLLGVSGWPPANATSHAWRVELRLQAVSFEAVELSVTWKREDPRSRAGGPGAGDTRVIKLSAGERYVLDLVQSDSPGSNLVNLVVQLEASRADDSPDRTMLEYDFWLVHEDRTGKKTTEHRSYGGFAGTKMSVDFAPLVFGLDGALVRGGSGAPFAVLVKAQLTSRIRPDGRIEVTHYTDKQLECGGGFSSGSGEKEFVAQDGETVGVELPAFLGWSVLPEFRTVPPGARPGVTSTPKGLRVSEREFFEGDRFSLVVRVRRFTR